MALHRGNGLIWEAHQLRLATARNKVRDAEIEGSRVQQHEPPKGSEVPDSPSSSEDEDDDGTSENQDSE